MKVYYLDYDKYKTKNDYINHIYYFYKDINFKLILDEIQELSTMYVKYIILLKYNDNYALQYYTPGEINNLNLLKYLKDYKIMKYQKFLEIK